MALRVRSVGDHVVAGLLAAVTIVGAIAGALWTFDARYAKADDVAAFARAHRDDHGREQRATRRELLRIRRVLVLRELRDFADRPPRSQPERAYLERLRHEDQQLLEELRLVGVQAP